MIPIKPKGTRWTDEQWQAIHQRGGNFLISAGAGSGKTAVLTKRVVELVKAGVDISNILVVTFTRAAALEMKTRIRGDLQKLLINGDEKIAHQLELLESANITTFDGFSLFIVKKYSDVLNVSRNLSIGDPVVLKQAKHNIVETLFDSYFEENNESFLDYLRRYSTKTDSTIKQSVIDLGDKLMKDPNFEDYLNTDYKKFFEDDYYTDLVIQTERLLNEQITYLKYFISRLHRVFPSFEQSDYIYKIENSLEPLISSNCYDDIYDFVSNYKIPSKPRGIFDEDEGVEFTNIRKYLKYAIDELKDICRCPMEEYMRDLNDNEYYISTLLSITKKYIELYHKYQQEHDIYDYQTIAYLSIQLIKNNPNIQTELQNLYTEIMVDEYQDTNLLQDSFVTLISKDNLYLVGDIKQSIYRFRDATPSLFQKKYVEYQQSETDTVIHLNKNFRSRSEVLTDINSLFTRTFDESLGGVDYNEAQKLDFGLEVYEKEKIFNQNYGLEILTYFDTEIESYDDEMSKKDKSRGMAELEAITIAKDVFDKVKHKHQIFDKELNSLRDARYDDFVILIDRKTNFELFQQKFKEFGVPLYIHKENEFISNMDVLVTFNLLKLALALKNEFYTKKYFKHSFLSVAFSHLCDYDKSDILRFLLNCPSNNPSDIKAYSVNTSFESLINYMCNLASNIDAMQIDEVLLELMNKFKVIEKTIMLGTIQSAEERQLFLLTKAEELKSYNFDLVKLIQYFDYIIYNQERGSIFETTDIEFVQGTSLAENKVNIMTIHKSKGLEFPIVYYPQLHPGWKSSSFDNIQYSKEFGIVIPAFREGLRTTLPKIINGYLIQKEDLSERMRVFYVALTRARESMVFVTKDTNDEESIQSLPTENIVDFAVRRKYKSYHNIVSSIASNYEHKLKQIYIDENYFTSRALKINENDLLIKDPKAQSYNYVSNAISEASITNETYSLRTPNFLSKYDLESIKIGNQYHKAFEIIDFNQLNTLDLSAFDSTYRDAIESFVNSELIQNNKNGTFYKEYEFASKINNTVHRGIIDLMIEHDDEIIVLDYKLKNISNQHYDEQVKGYCEYITGKTGKKTTGYLYSLMDKTIKRVM